MKKVKLKIASKIGEVPTVGSFLIASYNNDVAAFTDYSLDYTVGYGTNLELDRKAIEQLIFPKQITSELKVITGRIYSNQDQVVFNINQLEGYAKRASGLTVGYKDFGFSEVRKANRSGDIEGLVTALENVTQLAGNAVNMAALTLKGYSAAKQTTLVGLMNSLETDNTAQNSKINDRAKLVEDNHVTINAFWDKLVDISDAGKRIFGTVSAEKNNQYVMQRVLGRMRNDAAKTAVLGVTEPKSRLEFKPLGGGRKRVAYANAKGEYKVPGIAVGEYQATKITKGKPNVVKNVVVETGGHVVENFG